MSSNKLVQKHFKMLNFSDKRQRLSGIGIQFILARCTQCFQLTNNAKNVFSCENISVMKHINTKKTVFFINTHEHWILIAVFPKRQCLIIDPLNMVKSWPDVLYAISSFCKNNNLRLFFFYFKFQRDNTQICGFLCLWATMKISQLSFLQFLQLRKVLQSNKISVIERGMMYKVHEHYRLGIQ